MTHLKTDRPTRLFRSTRLRRPAPGRPDGEGPPARSARVPAPTPAPAPFPDPAAIPAPDPAGTRAARRRDRRVYTRSHPVLFALLAAARRRPVVRLGSTVLVHGTEAYRETLTQVPLDRTAAGTTGGAARQLSGAGTLFDQDGTGHRQARRSVAGDLGATGTERLRPAWRAVLDRRLAPLAAGRPVDLAEVVRELAGTTVRALLALEPATDPHALSEAAARAAATAVRDHLPGPRRPGTARAAATAAARLEALLTAGDGDPDPSRTAGDASLRAMLAVAAVSTTVAALPRAAAWCADAGLWEQAADEALRPALVTELLRVTAASPLLPRVAAADATAAGCPVRAGDRLLLVARHAARAHSDPPDARHPAPPSVAQLVFGAGPHACPGARVARAQLDDLLAALAPYRPVVVRARVDRAAALPGWRTLVVRATAGEVR
ncbi:cytochrome P450 [Streptomyces sp. LP05-1]|uniref:Cytochrome P450 n=1 Tax=Streptomyces pyxinae TaxID=2970734 RepID=A0ABT2CLK4_9ACTN|nr:cytochrome P450 [Streptomyces sp. LP05-1]MCS0637444.1 cytochrome P450 [Streptomyces sp. LP05-1]